VLEDLDTVPLGTTTELDDVCAGVLEVSTGVLEAGELELPTTTLEEDGWV
jgi:hypothetical protein